MNGLFLKIMNMSISASWLVLTVLAFRFVLRKAPKWINVLLWGMVAVRLICPFSIESAWSLVPSAETIPTNIEMDTAPAIDSGIGVMSGVQSDTSAPDTDIHPLPFTIAVCADIWIAGMAALLLYIFASYRRLRRKVHTAVLLRGSIFQSENVSSPFVLGIFRARIYLPFRIDAQDLEHVIAHEQAHIRRKDHWWKPLGFLLLTVHWFNPLMWLAYVLLCKDIELACDEKVIKELDSGQRAGYAHALVACSVGRRMAAAFPPAFGGVGIKDRVKCVMNYKKPAFWVVALAVAACAAVAVCFLTNPPASARNPRVQEYLPVPNTGIPATEPAPRAAKWFDYTSDMSDMDWDHEITTQISEFPGVTFSYKPEQISRQEDHAVLIAGMPIWNAYFCDLTGDGLPEICASLSMGSGMIDNRVIIYDYANGVSYSLQDRGNYDYYLRMGDDGCLYVDKKVYLSEELHSSGRLVFKDGCIQVEGVTS